MVKNSINQPVYMEEDEIDLRKLFSIFWKYKMFMAIFVFTITSLAIVYALSKPNEYKVYTLLAPREQSKDNSSEITPDQAFQGLINDYTFMKNFIQKYKIAQKLASKKLESGYVFAMNNDSIYRFFHSKEDTTEPTQKKMSFFNAYKSLKGSFSISTNKEGIITISFTGPNREFDYFVLNKFLKEATKFLVKKNLKDLNSQINRYQLEFTKDDVKLELKFIQLVSNLIKQKVYINTSKYYKVKVLTNPYIPDAKDKVKPKRALIVMVAFVTSFILSIFLVFFIEFIKSSKDEEESNV